MISRNGHAGRPLRALAGLGLALAAWLAVRLPAMQSEVHALAERATALDRPIPQRQALPRPVPIPAPPDIAARAPLPHHPLPPLRAPPAAVRVPMSLAPSPLASAAAPPTMEPAIPPLPAAPPPALPAPVRPPDPAFTLANAAYARVRAGQRRQAAALLDAALALQPGNRQWQADRKALGRRWQLGGFALLRDGGPLPNQPGSGLPGLAASPVLGGGQVGGSIAYVTDPFARRPLALVVRANVAADPQGVRSETAQLALGLRQTLLPGVSLSVERLIPLGDATRGGFTARLAAGGTWQRLEAYGEAGVIDTGAIYAGGQARARIVRIGPAAVHAAGWASVQTGTPDVWRVDVGPSVSARLHGIRIEADWRQRIGGNAAPGSGPVLTVSAGF